jgi:2-methylcitrate dehydratase
VQVFFRDGSCTEKVTVEYPLGHRRRRSEALPLLEHKFRQNLARLWPPHRHDAIVKQCESLEHLQSMSVSAFMDVLVA